MEIVNDARNRLLADLSEVHDDKEKDFEHIAVMPLSGENLFEWHINIVPQVGALEGHVFHMTMTFEQTYPETPPSVYVKAPLEGPHVLKVLGKQILNLDILDATNGWSASRTAVDVLRKIDEFWAQYTGSPEHIDEVIVYTKNYHCKLTQHSYDNPVPWPACIPGKHNESSSPQKTYVNNPSNEWQVAKATSGVGWGKVMYEAKLDKVEKMQNYGQLSSYVDPTSNICSCRFGWATADSEENAISGIFYGNGKNSHIIIRAKTKIKEFTDLGEQETFVEGDVIWAGVDFEENKAWFARNGKKVGKEEGYKLPEFLVGQKLFPVVGLQNSAVQLNFGTPKFVVPNTEGFMTIDKHKTVPKTDYLWYSRRDLPNGWNESLFLAEHEGKMKNVSVNIFSFLRDSELLKCECVCTDWRRLISESYLLQRSKLRCSVLRCSFRECVLGMGLIVEYTDDKKNIRNVRTELEYFSWKVWTQRDVRSGPAKVSYTHFLPLIINNDHARKSVDILTQVLPSFLPELNSNFTAENVLAVLTALLNGTISTLANEGAKPSDKDTLKQLELYTHLHHMLLYLNKHHFQNELSDLAALEIKTTLENTKLLEKNNLYDIGKFMMLMAVTPQYQWKNIRKAVLLELFDRDVPKYLERYPELEIERYSKLETDDEKAQTTWRLRKVMDCIVYERRKTMLQTWFTVNVNKEVDSLDGFLEDYSKRFGGPSKKLIDDIAPAVQGIYNAEDWEGYFKGLYLKPVDPNFMINLLDESMSRASKKKYYTPLTQQPDYYTDNRAMVAEEPPAHHQPGPVVVGQQGPPPPRQCTDFTQLPLPLAACLEDCEPLPLQSESLPIITRGSESVIVSPLGTGKHTLAAITVVNTLLQSSMRNAQILVLVPERNQAIHFEEILSDIYVHVPEADMRPHAKIPIRVCLCIKGERMPNDDILNHRNVMVGTPFVVLERMNKKFINPNRLQAVYILEGDVLLTYNHTRKKIYDCFQHIHVGIQTVFMAATFSPYVKECYAPVSGGTVLESGDFLEKTSFEKSSFNHWFVGCIQDWKKPEIFELLCHVMKFEQGIGFVANTGRVKEYHKYLTETSRCGEIGYLHKDMDAEERREQVRNFNENKTRILITEDLPLYGVKTGNVTCVVHIDAPRLDKPQRQQPDTFVFTSSDTALDGYERRLSNFLQCEQTVHSICFSIRHIAVETFLTSVKRKYGIEELPEDPNTI